MDDIYSILEVATLLDITTQAVYKRLQLDQETLEPYLSTKGGRKSLTKPGVEKLSEMMGIDNPFTPEDETKSFPTDGNDDATVDNAQGELLQYLRDDNKRLMHEIEELKRELTESRTLREADRKASEAERRQHEEARMRADTLLMKAMMNQEKPRLLERIFGRKAKPEKVEE